MPIENQSEIEAYTVRLIASIHQKTAIKAIDCLHNGDVGGCTEILSHMIEAIDTLLGNTPNE